MVNLQLTIKPLKIGVKMNQNLITILLKAYYGN